MQNEVSQITPFYFRYRFILIEKFENKFWIFDQKESFHTIEEACTAIDNFYIAFNKSIYIPTEVFEEVENRETHHFVD